MGLISVVKIYENNLAIVLSLSEFILIFGITNQQHSMCFFKKTNFIYLASVNIMTYLEAF